MRASFNAFIIVTLFVGGCSQVSSPTSPSFVAPGASAAAIGPPIATLLAQLNLVDNHIVSANHQVTLYLIPGNPVIPPNPIVLQNALNFYVKANDVLDTVAIPGNPVTPQWNAALNAIVGHTLELFLMCDACIPGNPIFPLITDQANHTITVATSLMSSEE